MLLTTEHIQAWDAVTLNHKIQEVRKSFAVTTEQLSPTFTLGDKKFTIKITTGMAMGELKEKFDLSILSMFSNEQQMQQAMQKMVFDDEGAIDLMMYFIDKSGSSLSKERIIELMPDLSILDEFRDAFWAAVVNFSGPLKKNILLQMWQEFKKDLKQTDLAKINSDA